MNKSNLVLASKSAYRAQLMNNAGLEFSSKEASIDERAVEGPLINTGSTPADIAEVLAIAKAMDVSQFDKTAYVIGSDQTLSLDGEMMHKPSDMEEARRRLLFLSGKTHYLNSAVVLVKNEEVIWSHVEIAAITMRHLSPEFVGQHLASVGEKALTSVGAYQIEGEGVQLFEKTQGDFFSIMGLPLLPLLAELRRLQIIQA